MSVGSCVRIAISIVLALSCVADAAPKHKRTSADPAVAEAERIYGRFDASTADSVTVKYLRACELHRSEQLDKAIAIFLDIVDHYRDHAVAVYAATLALDAYNRLQRYAELVALTERLAADRAWLANKAELANTLRRIRIASLRGRGHRGVEREPAALRVERLPERVPAPSAPGLSIVEPPAP